jgi:hypothetical protein
MKSIRSQSKSPKKALIALVILALILSAGGVYAYVNKVGPFSSKSAPDINYNPPTDEQVKAGEETKQQSIENSTKSSGKPVEAGSQSDNSTRSSKQVTIDITNSPLTRTGSTLSVNTIIQKTGTSGTCTLILSKSGQTSVTKTAPSQISGTVATCAGFRNIDISRLAAGKWTVTVSYRDTDSSGSVSESVNL